VSAQHWDQQHAAHPFVVSEARKTLIGCLTFEPVDERQEELPLQPFHSVSISASQPCCLMNTNTSPQLMNNKQVPLPTSQHAHEILLTLPHP
jgi:hypothetical protein